MREPEAPRTESLISRVQAEWRTIDHKKRTARVLSELVAKEFFKDPAQLTNNAVTTATDQFQHWESGALVGAIRSIARVGVKNLAEPQLINFLAMAILLDGREKSATLDDITLFE